MVKKAAKKTTKVPTKPKSPKATTAKPSFISKVKAVWDKHWQLILVSGVVIGILGFIGINQLIIYNQKQQFKAAEESLDALYADIVKQTGQPTSMTKDKSCGYASTEIGRGRIGCSVSIGAEFSAVNDLDATNYGNTIKRILETNSSLTVIFEQKGEYKKGQSSTVMDYPSFTIKLNRVNSLSCDLSIKYFDKDDRHNYPAITYNKIRLYLGCGGYPRTEIYPVKN